MNLPGIRTKLRNIASATLESSKRAGCSPDQIPRLIAKAVECEAERMGKGLSVKLVAGADGHLLPFISWNGEPWQVIRPW